MLLKAFAKINYVLDITGRRDDGYHTLDTVFQPVSLFDTLEAEKTAGEFLFSCSDPALAGEDNLACRAYRQMKAHYGFSGGMKLRLEKRIPSQAGLGGGSSDAAAVLKLCNTLFELGLSREALMREGALLGADVPCFMIEGPSRGRGTGTELTPIFGGMKLPLLILKPSAACSTPLMYRRLDAAGIGGDRGRGDAAQAALERRDRRALISVLHNDFEAVASEEEIRLLLRELRREGAAASLLCGSGSAVCGFFENEDLRNAAYGRYLRKERNGLAVFSCETLCGEVN